MRQYRDFKNYNLEKLKNLNEAKIYLSVALREYERDNNAEAFLLALRDVAKAQGGLSILAQNTNLNRPNLYRALSERGSPRLGTVGIVLRELGFRLSVEPIGSRQ